MPSRAYFFGMRAQAVGTIAGAVTGFVFADGIRELLRLWGAKEEYSHAYLLPLLSLFLIWQRKNELRANPWQGSWAAVAITVFGLLLYFLGTLSTIYAVIQYAFFITVCGLVLSYAGFQNLRHLWAALLLLFFTVPLPTFLYQALSMKLQLISSELGVAVIRAFGVSVFLEGNVIDLGSYKLQVVEACNGLRYLFPLASFGFLCAYLYRGPIWQKFVIFLSTIPITVLMNSFRIGVIGYTVDRWGQKLAEGFLHDFEGWAIFMACLAVLFAEIAVLARLQRPARTFADTFFIELPAPAPPRAGAQPVPKQFLVSLGLLIAAGLVAYSIGKRPEIVPTRAAFAEFPLEIGNWRGESEVMEQVYVDTLKFTDYVMVNYRESSSGAPVNFYVAYYASQKAGESAHSPRSCIPGGGWKIEDLSQLALQDVPVAGSSLPVNRVQIAMGENKQLVYYWFQQRGRIITNEYLVKWYLLWDSIVKNRSDGALVRVTTMVPAGGDWASGDARLQSFLKAVGPTLEKYVPN